MSYTSKVVPTLWVKEWYDRVAGAYHEYRDHLNSFDDAERRRYLPRSLQGTKVLDLWAWDGRTFDRFQDVGFAQYWAADISADLLALHPQQEGVETFVVDLEDERPWNEQSVDVVTSFFVIEHIADIQHVAESVAKILRDDGVWIMTYFPQRKEWTHGQWQDAFKIKLHYHRYEDIEEAMCMAWLEVHEMDLLDDGVTVGKVYAGVKK